MIGTILQAIIAVSNVVAGFVKPKKRQEPLDHAEVAKGVKQIKEWANDTSATDWEIVKKGKKH